MLTSWTKPSLRWSLPVQRDSDHAPPPLKQLLPTRRVKGRALHRLKSQASVSSLSTQMTLCCIIRTAKSSRGTCPCSQSTMHHPLLARFKIITRFQQPLWARKSTRTMSGSTHTQFARRLAARQGKTRKMRHGAEAMMRQRSRVMQGRVQRVPIGWRIACILHRLITKGQCKMQCTRRTQVRRRFSHVLRKLAAILAKGRVLLTTAKEQKFSRKRKMESFTRKREEFRNLRVLEAGSFQKLLSRKTRRVLGPWTARKNQLLTLQVSLKPLRAYQLR